MKLSTVPLVAALALGSAGAFAAGGPLDLSSGSAGFASTPTAGSFTELFTFSLAGAATLTGAVSSVVSGAQDIDFSSIMLSGPSGSFAFSATLGDPFELWTISTPALSAGNYTLTLVGVNSPSIATYSGNIAITSVVPEPTTFAMLLAGFGAVGFLAVRRRTIKG